MLNTTNEIIKFEVKINQKFTKYFMSNIIYKQLNLELKCAINLYLISKK